MTFFINGVIMWSQFIQFFKVVYFSPRLHVRYLSEATDTRLVAFLQTPVTALRYSPGKEYQPGSFYNSIWKRISGSKLGQTKFNLTPFPVYAKGVLDHQNKRFVGLFVAPIYIVSYLTFGRARGGGNAPLFINMQGVWI